MKTKNGIYLDLTESEYVYNFGGLSFYFSSEFYRNKFKNEVKNYVQYETMKIVSKYDIKVSFDIMLAISLYKKIEKRGFRVLDIESKKEITKDVLIGGQIFLI